jgi:putative hydrolase of the HAD superfamily
MLRPTTVLTDADNTLWDTDFIFQKAQLGLLEAVENLTGERLVNADRLEFTRRYDQVIASKHHAHLRYPPQLLVTALAAGLASIPAEEVAADVIAGRSTPLAPRQEDLDRLVSQYSEALRAAAPLLPTVRDGLELARSLGMSLQVLTEGTIDRQRKLIEFHDLSDYFDGVLQITKSEEQFMRVRKIHQGADLFVIGDQEDRDIRPAISVGCVAILIPSRFRPLWNSTDRASLASFVASTFLEAMRWIESNSGGMGRGGNAP